MEYSTYIVWGVLPLLFDKWDDGKILAGDPAPSLEG
jgi:hypothetical protein